MASIVVNGDTSGSITLSAPAVAGSSVLTLPAVTDTVAGIAATQTLTNKSIVATQLTGTIAAARLPAGSVLQVVNATYSTSTSTTSLTLVDTGLTATITPTSASSKILVIVDQGGVGKVASIAGSGVGLALLRGATSILNFAEYAAYTNSVATNYVGSVSANYLDSPATTSATTYKTQFKQSDSSANTVLVQNNSSISTITLIEIAA